MPKSNLVSILTLILFSTTLATAEVSISPANDPIQICDTTPYIELNAIGDPTNRIYTWTVNDDIYAYGPTIYYVPEEGDSNNLIRLYQGVIPNGTTDKDLTKLLDEVTINVNDCDI